jgi:hypothetical protein
MLHKLNILVLEDEIERRKWFNKVFFRDNITFCFSSKKAIKCLKHEHYDMIFLDRDLGNTKDNGEKVVLEMMKEKLCLGATIVIHSMNPQGQESMKSYLDKNHKEVYVIPYTQLLKMKRKDFS